MLIEIDSLEGNSAIHSSSGWWMFMESSFIGQPSLILFTTTPQQRFKRASVFNLRHSPEDDSLPLLSNCDLWPRNELLLFFFFSSRVYLGFCHQIMIGIGSGLIRVFYCHHRQ